MVSPLLFTSSNKEKEMRKKWGEKCWNSWHVYSKFDIVKSFECFCHINGAIVCSMISQFLSFIFGNSSTRLMETLLVDSEKNLDMFRRFSFEWRCCSWETYRKSKRQSIKIFRLRSDQIHLNNDWIQWNGFGWIIWFISEILIKDSNFSLNIGGKWGPTPIQPPPEWKESRKRVDT